MVLTNNFQKSITYEFLFKEAVAWYFSPTDTIKLLITDFSGKITKMCHCQPKWFKGVGYFKKILLYAYCVCFS